jgi:hypothetical protein
MAENWLRQYGFNSVQLPRRDLTPMDVLLKGGDGQFSTKVGALPMVLSNQRQPPAVTSGEPTANIARSVTRKVEAKLGISILGSLLGAVTGSKLGVEGGLNRASELSITYEDVLQDSVPIIELQGWMEGAEVEAPRQALTWLNDDELATITGVLRSAKLSVSGTRTQGGSLELDVPAISGIVSGTAKVSAEGSTSSTITFEGAEPIAFGLQVFRMIYEGNVSFGLEEVRAIAPPDHSRKAWTSDAELPEIGDRPLEAAVQ